MLFTTLNSEVILWLLYNSEVILLTCYHSELHSLKALQLLNHTEDCLTSLKPYSVCLSITLLAQIWIKSAYSLPLCTPQLGCFTTLMSTTDCLSRTLLTHTQFFTHTVLASAFQRLLSTTSLQQLWIIYISEVILLTVRLQLCFHESECTLTTSFQQLPSTTVFNELTFLPSHHFLHARSFISLPQHPPPPTIFESNTCTIKQQIQTYVRNVH
jgi:hypothetical protein